MHAAVGRPPRASSLSLCLGLALLVGLLLSACSTPSTKTYEIRQRAFDYSPTKLVEDYREEYAYIETRRQKLAQSETGTAPGPSAAVSAVPTNLKGLAFSGGGIRSATFHLGMLEALQEMGTLREMDYLSTVSGGSYVAGWFLGHLGPDKEDSYGNLVRTKQADRLLDPREDFVAHLRHHAGFIREEGFWEGPALIWGYLWRLPAHLVWDVLLHIKTYPNIGNFFHLFTPYQRRIEATYLRGQHDRPLTHVNGPLHLGPYLVLNGNLVNRGRPRSYPTEAGRPYRDQFNFEFTKDFTGSDGLGYVETLGFGLPVARVLNENKEPAAFNPRFVEVQDPTDGGCSARGRLRTRADYCLRLSEAMTASGAGLDVDSLKSEWIRDDIARALLGLAFAPFNLNNEFQAWNFARRWNGGWGTFWDYTQMLTLQRLWPNTQSRWLEITDGSFYDNLGAQSLLRRDVAHLIVGDATLDTEWDYHYLHNLQARVREYFGKGVLWCGEIPADGSVSWYRRFWVRRPEKDGAGGTVTAIHYLKPFVANPALMEKKHWFGKPDLLSIDSSPQSEIRPLAIPEGEQTPLPAHLDIDYLRTLTTNTHILDELAEGVKKVRKFARSPEAKDFPQTETLVQWFSLEEFEAYRYLGYLMGWAYLSQTKLDQPELSPATTCTAVSPPSKRG